MKVFGIFLIAIAVAIFYFCWFVAAPFVTDAIPASEYKRLFDIIAYVIIAWAGGVALPLMCVISGAMFLFISEESL